MLFIPHPYDHIVHACNFLNFPVENSLDFIMSMKDIILFVLICLSSFQVCATGRCQSYKQCRISQYCDKVKIEHASVRYSQQSTSTTPWWKATVTCKEGFHLSTHAPIICYNNGSFMWTVDIDTIHCEPDKEPVPAEDKNSLVPVYITVPIVILLLIAVVSFVIVRVLRKRKISRNRCRQNKIQTVTNRTYDAAPDFVDCNDDLYVDIDEPYIKPSGPEDSEYNTLHMNTHINNNSSQIYHHITVQPSTSSCKNVEPETDTYSHLKDINTDKGRSGVHNSDNITDNIYNKLQIDTRRGIKELDSASVDPYYDHTGARCGVSPVIELDIYAHVNDVMTVDVNNDTKP